MQRLLLWGILSIAWNEATGCYFFVLGRTDYSVAAREQTAADTNVSGLIAFAAGAIVGCVLYFTKVSLSGVPTIESFLSAGLVYWLLETVRVRSARSRLWRISKPPHPSR